MSEQFGLAHLWAQGDLVTRAVALLLLVMSIASWWVIVVKTLNLRRQAAHARRIEDFWRSPDLRSGLGQWGDPADNAFARLAIDGEAADGERTRLPQLQEALGASEWISRCLRNSIDESTARLQSGLAILASVGSTAPFVGLFGTVWGIYHALLSISSAGQASIDQVAGPIGEALVMTALGLAVAIPAVLGYNALVRGNKSVVARLNRFAHDLHACLLSGAWQRMPRASGASGPAATPAPLAHGA